MATKKSHRKVIYETGDGIDATISHNALKSLY